MELRKLLKMGFLYFSGTLGLKGTFRLSNVSLLDFRQDCIYILSET